jgi:hypothetical protein
MREALDPRSRSKEIILHKKLGAEYPTLKFEFLRRPSRELSIFPSTKFDDLVRSRKPSLLRSLSRRKPGGGVQKDLH